MTREQLACLICKDQDKWTCDKHPSVRDGCKQELEVADRVIAAGWKSPEECGHCIDTSEFARVAIKKAVSEARRAVLKECGGWLASTERIDEDTQDSDLYDPNAIQDGIDELKSGIEPWREK